MKTDNEKDQEQKFNEDKEYLEFKFQRGLEKTKRKEFWMTILTSILLVLIIVVAFHDTRLVFPSCLVSIILIILIFLRMRDIRMINIENELGKKIEKETKYIKKFKEEYELLRLCKFTEIPISLRKTAETLLYTSMIYPPKEDIYKVIKAQETEIENMEIQLQVYKDCPERNFWQYFISWKWIKKLPHR